LFSHGGKVRRSFGSKPQERELPLIGKLDPQVKALLEQLRQTQCCIRPQPHLFLRWEKVVASRQKVSASSAFGIAFGSGLEG